MTLPSSGPAIVAIGGGRGLAASLGALRRVTDDVTAVVSVADNGGSTGRLRAAQDQPAPGDLRKCLVALADPASPLAKSLEYRFDEGELRGHALGNLLLGAMTDSCGGLVEAIRELEALLGVVGRVCPATVKPVDLVATTTDGATVRGQVDVMATFDIDRVSLEPAETPADLGVIEALGRADLIVLGPGSLFTSVLAAAAVPDIGDAIRSSGAPLAYICNLRPQPAETAGYGVAKHLDALGRHGLEPAHVLFDPATIGEAGEVVGARPHGLADASGEVHDADLLEKALRSLLEDLDLIG